MRKYRLMAAAMLILTAACGKVDPDIPDKPDNPDTIAEGQFNPAKDKVILTHEFRGVWLATVSGTDWPKTKNNAESQKQELVDYIKAAADSRCNTVIFQVCSNMDAIWPSKLLPWSSVLSGTEGTDPGYDPVELAVKTAHQYGLEIHAWINPQPIPIRKKAGHRSRSSRRLITSTIISMFSRPFPAKQF